MAAGDKSIRYSSYCVPQEQVSSGGKFYLDGDCGKKLSGEATLTISNNYNAPSIITATNTSAYTGLDFIAIKALDISEGSYVLISLDDGDTYRIRLLKDECFAANIASGAEVIIAICTATNGSGTGAGKVEVWSGT